MASIADNLEPENIIRDIAACNQQLIAAQQSPAEAIIIENFLKKYPLPIILQSIGGDKEGHTNPESNIALVAEFLNRIFFNKCNMTIISPNLAGTMDYLVLGLTSVYGEIQTLSLRVLNHIFDLGSKNNENITENSYNIDPQFVKCLINLLESENIKVGKEVVDVLSKYGMYCSQANRESLLVQMVDHFRASADEDSIIQVRISEIIIRICHLKHRFHQCIETGALSLVEELLVNDDVLVQMNVIEVIKMLAATPHGAKHLLGNNVCDKLFRILGVAFDGNNVDGTTSEEAVEPLLWGGAIELLGRICTTSLSEEDAADESVSKDRSKKVAIFIVAAVTIMRNHSSGDSNMALIALDAIRLFAKESYDNAWIVYNHHTCIDTILTWTGCASNEFRGLAFHTLADLFREAKLNADRGKLLYQRIGASNGSDNTDDMLLEHVVKPLQETKHGILDMFAAILETVWGVRVLMSNKRFEDYLLNTKAESGYIDKQWKFVLLQNLRNNVDGWNLLREELKDDLLTILKNGPFYTLSGGLEVKTEQA